MPPLSVKPFRKFSRNGEVTKEEEIYIANEWISPVQGWSEGALVMAENMLYHYFDFEKPDWIRRENYT